MGKTSYRGQAHADTNVGPCRLKIPSFVVNSPTVLLVKSQSKCDSTDLLQPIDRNAFISEATQASVLRSGVDGPEPEGCLFPRRIHVPAVSPDFFQTSTSNATCGTETTG